MTDPILKSSLYAAKARMRTSLRTPYHPAPPQGLAVYRVITVPTGPLVAIRDGPPATQAGEGSQPHPRMHLALLRGCHERRTHTSHSGNTREAPVTGGQCEGIAPLAPTVISYIKPPL